MKNYDLSESCLAEGEIPVVFTPDENFMIQTAVAILSMLDSKKEDTQYHFFILVSKEIDKKCFSYLAAIKKIHCDFTYTLTFFDASSMNELKINTAHVSVSTFYRLLLAEIYDWDKCMYHDGDILVYDDLRAMYDIDMGNNYIAGIKTITQHQGSIFDQRLIDEWNFPSMDQYVFAGDIVLFLKNIRDNKVTEYFIKEMKKGYPQQDQDVLNFCCYNHIHFLPLRYCFLNRWMFNNEIYKFKNQIHSIQEIEDAKNNPAIVHFAGYIVKPWVNIRAAYAKEWWQFAKRILNRQEYNRWHDEVESMTKQRDWSYIIESLKRLPGEIYIFGYTKYAKQLKESLEKNGVYITAFIDNDTKKQGFHGDDFKIISVQDSLNAGKASYVIASQKAYKEITDQLLGLGVNRDNIFRYEAKTDLYYVSLSPEYYEYEYKDLMAPVLGIKIWEMDVEDIKRLDREKKWEFIWR